MKQLTEQQITDNWKDLRTIINNTFSGDRLENLNQMYDYFEDRMCMAPASGREHYHNAMVGGYVEHILHVVKFAQQVRDMWEQNGATINFTNEELVFAALHHDLGKIGDLENDYYIPEESDWHRKNQGSIYKHNPELQYMTVSDRSCWILGHFQIPMTEWEFLGLRLTDGLYEEANEKYYKGFNPQWELRSNIAYILHQADMMATHIESDQWKRGDKVESAKVQKSVSKIKEAVDKQVDKNNEVKEKFTKSTDAKDIFNELFGEAKK
tara:strand:- start:340 stop:1140 length:801 start_codon:yes stop_codon:yes gene_type:complete